MLFQSSPSTANTNRFWGFLGVSAVKDPSANAGDTGSIPGSGNPLVKDLTTHSSIFSWEIPWTEEPGGLQSMGPQKSPTHLSN